MINSFAFGGGSIPAHAGEPQLHPDVVELAEVYPRPRGGTPRHPPAKGDRPGLSPPTRGNLAATRTTGRRRGSIPAHAGEPPPRSIPNGD